MNRIIYRSITYKAINIPIMNQSTILGIIQVCHKNTIASSFSHSELLILHHLGIFLSKFIQVSLLNTR